MVGGNVLDIYNYTIDLEQMKLGRMRVCQDILDLHLHSPFKVFFSRNKDPFASAKEIRHHFLPFSWGAFFVDLCFFW